MCKFYSAIVMRNGDILHNANLTSHEDLIQLFNINDSQNCCDNLVEIRQLHNAFKFYLDRSDPHCYMNSWMKEFLQYENRKYH